jgi:hypothetical protein
MQISKKQSVPPAAGHWNRWIEGPAANGDHDDDRLDLHREPMTQRNPDIT